MLAKLQHSPKHQGFAGAEHARGWTRTGGIEVGTGAGLVRRTENRVQHHQCPSGNRRAETVLSLGVSASTVSDRNRRVLRVAPATGWAQAAVPYLIYLKDHAPFAFAGIWEHWERDGKTLDSCSIIVTQANTLMKPVHDRMPVILPPDLYDAWMDPSVGEPETLLPLLAPYPVERMTMHKVKTTVNSPRNEGPELIQPCESLCR